MQDVACIPDLRDALPITYGFHGEVQGRTTMGSSGSGSPFREIEDADLDAVAERLAAGFPRHTRASWEQALLRLRERNVPEGQTRFGYLLEDDGVKGVVLAISSVHDGHDGPMVLTNISSWCVAPTHRGPVAKGLYAHASRSNNVTFSNLSAATHTIKTITQLGYEGWTTGQFCGFGTGAASGFGGILSIDQAVSAGLSTSKVKLLEDHARQGCLVFCLRIDDRIAPLIFLKRHIKGFLPLAQLIYCEDFSHFTEHSRRINLKLVSLGYPLILVDSSGEVSGLKGRYFHGKSAKYYKGPRPSAAVDHTYSEMIYIGF